MKRNHHHLDSVFWVTVFCSFFLTSIAYADSAARFSSRTMLEYHKDKVDDSLLPFSQYGLFHWSEYESATDVWVNFRFARSLSDSGNRFDLFHGEVRFDYFRKYATLELGRFALVEGIDDFLLDGGRLEGEVTPYVDWSLFGGLTRNARLDEKIDAGSLAGARIRIRPYSNFKGQINFLMEKYEDHSEDRRIGLSISQKIVSPFRGALDGGVDYSLTASHISQAKAVGDVYFSKVISANVTYLFRDPRTNRDHEKDLIFDLFAIGGFHSARVGATYSLKKFYIALTPNFEEDFYLARDDQTHQGHRAAFGVQTLPNPTEFVVGAKYAHWQSWGGSSHILTCWVSRKITRKTEFALNGETIFYEKRTNEKAAAHRVLADFTWQFAKYLRLTASVEGITNERYSKDLRALMMLEGDYAMGKGDGG